MNLNIKPIFWRWLPWLIIAFGIILRLDQYLFNRSLWLDEAFFAIDVVNRTFLELFEAPLEYTSYARPPGFMLMVKLSVTWFGNSDFILRLFPFFCGVLALLLYYPMAKRYVSERAVPLALFFFAISEALIFYSSEFKQYSSDVLIVILLFFVDCDLSDSRLNACKIIYPRYSGHNCHLVFTFICFHFSHYWYLSRLTLFGEKTMATCYQAYRCLFGLVVKFCSPLLLFYSC